MFKKTTSETTKHSEICINFGSPVWLDSEAGRIFTTRLYKYNKFTWIGNYPCRWRPTNTWTQLM